MRYNKWIKDWKTALAENFFLRAVVLLLLVGLILNATVFKKKTIVVVSPPEVTRQYWIAEDSASPEYMRQMAVFFSTLAGNISPDNAAFAADVIASYVVPARYEEVKTDLSSQAEYIKKNNVTQSFYPASTKVDQEENSAAVEGTVDRYVGTTRISHEKMVYHMVFVTQNYATLLQQFYVEYPGRTSQRTPAPSREDQTSRFERPIPGPDKKTTSP
jgi:conjugal transfer pilus assembly protein TraE